MWFLHALTTIFIYYHRDIHGLNQRPDDAWTLVAGTMQAEAGPNNLNNCGIYGHDINTPWYVPTVGSNISEKVQAFFGLSLVYGD